MAKKRRSNDEFKEIDALVERLCEFVRLNYVTAAEIARQIGVRDSTGEKNHRWYLHWLRQSRSNPKL
jgi:hypothetical protein